MPPNPSTKSWSAWFDLAIYHAEHYFLWGVSKLRTEQWKKCRQQLSPPARRNVSRLNTNEEASCTAQLGKG